MAGNCTSGTLLNHTDMDAINVASQKMTNATARDCQQLCCSRQDCFGFTFADPQPVGLVATSDSQCVGGQQCCWLKGPAGQAKAGCRECTSGFKQVEAPRPAKVQRHILPVPALTFPLSPWVCFPLCFFNQRNCVLDNTGRGLCMSYKSTVRTPA